MALVESAVPKSNAEVSGLFKDYDFNLVESLDISLIEMIALQSLRFVPADVSYPDDSYPKLRWFVPNAKMIRTQSLDDSYPCNNQVFML